MRHTILTSMLLIAISHTAFAQIEYQGKTEIGYMRFQHHTIQVDPGPGWKGYNLNNSGIDINLMNGLSVFNNKIFVGIGLGYLNFEGIQGVSVFADLEYLPLKSRATPLLNLKIGHVHIWNQYEGGTRTMLGEIAIGINYKLNEKIGLYLKSGILLTQQSFLIPTTIGFRF